MSTLVTMTEISEQLKIPRTTLNEWMHQFDDYIPSSGEGRSKRYIIPDALEVFRTIAKLKQKDTSVNEILLILQGSFPLTIHEAQEQQPVLFMSMLEEVATELKRSNELKEQEILIRLQEIQEQQKFRSDVLENLQRKNDDVTQALIALREARQEAAATSSMTKKRWWKTKKKD